MRFAIGYWMAIRQLGVSSSIQLLDDLIECRHYLEIMWLGKLPPVRWRMRIWRTRVCRRTIRREAAAEFLERNAVAALNKVTLVSPELFAAKTAPLSRHQFLEPTQLIGAQMAGYDPGENLALRFGRKCAAITGRPVDEIIEMTGSLCCREDPIGSVRKDWEQRREKTRDAAWCVGGQTLDFIVGAGKLVAEVTVKSHFFAVRIAARHPLAELHA